MIYQAEVTRSAGGSSDAPSRSVLRLTKGLIYKVEIDFPPGCSGLVGVKILDGDHQVWPSTHGEFFTGDGHTITFEDLRWKMAEPWQYDVWVYNEDDTYSHTVTVRVGMHSADAFIGSVLNFDMSSSITELGEIIEKITAVPEPGILGEILSQIGEEEEAQSE